ncbi:MAG TPA: glycoside hydrolase family 48 protein [Actinophytocola sp.]|uniref:glycoside hydrolase family 48 protein n=1 Tax=Actinophytocola sp. TaxID=1872138 RepID=UPI002DDCD33D|nr:glycoside hydrolase family 48 protein [Actinophytocola sp.]HEV2778080.1 glycoside hydrolase family 48 protein [Actinophytocola sp.]
MRRPHRLGALPSVALALLLVATPVAASSEISPQAVACSVNYGASNWGGGGGFTANLRITNLGDTLNGWTLTFTFPGTQRVSQGWNATWTQAAGSANVSATNLDWNRTLTAGQATDIGFNGTFTGTNTAPTSFAINGVTCNGANSAPTATLTAPATGSTFTAGSDIALAATAADSDGTVARVEFFAGNTLIGSDTSSPYGLTWNDVPAGNYVLVARAIDNAGAVGNSAPVDITVTPDTGPSIVAAPSAINVPENGTANVSLRLDRQPAGNVTVTTARTSGDTNLTVSAGATRTFTPDNWNTAQTVTLAAAEDADSANGVATFTASATGQGSATITATEADNDLSTYAQRFMQQYNKIMDPANGYFSSHNPKIPYHSVETLIVEAPDYGHVTTSEAYSFWIWLEAEYGQATQDWTRFNTAWQSMETHIIPTAADQPSNAAYNPNDTATYAPEQDLPSQYPVPLDANVQTGPDPLANELQSTYGTRDVYGMHWLLDVDNRYGYGRRGNRTGSPAYINTFQRGPQESVWETVPHPSWEPFNSGQGGPNGFLPLFIQDSQYARQWRYTNAPDADARAVQAAYWANVWATQQGRQADVAATVAKAAKLGDFLRYAFYDKYFKQVGNCVGPTTCPAGSGKNSSTGLLTWYYAWGGATDGSWAWRIGSGQAHFGYQNPMAAHVLANVAALRPQSPTAAADWAGSLQRQLEFYRWLQSNEGAIAGGASNSWAGRYAQPPAGTPTFYGMFYDFQPVYHDPPSNQWFGFQAWSMERVAEYYNVTGNALAKTVLDKWTAWARANTTVNVAAGTWSIPNEMSWSGAPDTWNPTSPGANAGLHVTIMNRGNDVGVTAAYARTLAYYAARSGDTASRDMAKNLLDAMWATTNQDTRGVSVAETRSDYNRFDDPVFVPSGFTGTMANGDAVNSSSTFIGIRSWYRDDPAWPQVQSYLNGGAVPSFRYHRFWAQADVAMAMADFGRLFP